MAPDPVATVLAFHPQDNNIIAVGMDDCTIKIYNVRLDEVSHSLPPVTPPLALPLSAAMADSLSQTKTSLRSHTKAVTGLAFSNSLGILVSAGGDSNVRMSAHM